MAMKLSNGSKLKSPILLHCAMRRKKRHTASTKKLAAAPKTSEDQPVRSTSPPDEDCSVPLLEITGNY